jgi:hypothetical protein
MSETAQRRASTKYRQRLAARGLLRFEVLGRARDRALIRDLARGLADGSVDPARLARELPPGTPTGLSAEANGHPVVRMFLTAPKVDVDLRFDRRAIEPRPVDL